MQTRLRVQTDENDARLAAQAEVLSREWVDRIGGNLDACFAGNAPYDVCRVFANCLDHFPLTEWDAVLLAQKRTREFFLALGFQVKLCDSLGSNPTPGLRISWELPLTVTTLP